MNVVSARLPTFLQKKTIVFSSQPSLVFSSQAGNQRTPNRVTLLLCLSTLNTSFALLNSVPHLLRLSTLETSWIKKKNQYLFALLNCVNHCAASSASTRLKDRRQSYPSPPHHRMNREVSAQASGALKGFFLLVIDLVLLSYTHIILDDQALILLA
jgi:hypothetical protein